MADSEFYSEMLAVAIELIEFFGQSVTLSVAGATSGDAFNPTPSAPAPHTVTAVEIDFKQSEIDGTSVLASDKQLIIRGDQWDPILLLSTVCTVGGIDYRIIGPLNPINPGGLGTLFFTAHVRA